MKKFFDYFKTLKDMSVAVGDAYKHMVATKEFNNERIIFSGLKWELTDNLYADFVAPIERNDIYSLSNCLNEELYYISKLNNILYLTDIKPFTFTNCISEMFDKQSSIFNSLCDSKRNEKTLKLINESRATLNGVNTSIILVIKNCLKTCDQPILNYAVVSGFFDIYKSIDITFSEVQRVIINNI